MKILVSSSEVASAIGKNRWKSQRETFENMFKSKFSKQYSKVKEYLKEREPDKLIGTEKDILEEIIHSAPELKELTIIGKTEIKKNVQKVNEVVETTQTKITTFLEKPENKHLEEHRETLQKHVKSQMRCESGIVSEPVIVKKFDIRDNNKEYLEFILGNFEDSSDVWGINGFCDGIDPVTNAFVEIKCRSSEFIFKSKTLPEYDRIQMHCYMKILNVDNMILRERLTTTGEEKTTNITFDEELWNETVLPELFDFVTKFHMFLKDEQLQMNYFALESEKEKNDFICGI